jgi:hypothetical protein
MPPLSFAKAMEGTATTNVPAIMIPAIAAINIIDVFLFIFLIKYLRK